MHSNGSSTGSVAYDKGAAQKSHDEFGVDS